MDKCPLCGALDCHELQSAHLPQPKVMEPFWNYEIYKCLQCRAEWNKPIPRKLTGQGWDGDTIPG